MNILERIVERKQHQVNYLKQTVTLNRLKQRFQNQVFERKSLIERVRKFGQFVLICEVKKASPSAGNIQPDVQPVAQALAYQSGGADAISVLTEQHFFKGSLKDLIEVKQRVQVPVLRKDFVIDEIQLWESAVLGADVVLLIAALLTKTQIAHFLDLATQLKLEVLLEIHAPQEIQKLPSNLQDYPVLLGINNRDLQTFTVNLDHSRQMIKHLPENIPRISESGIQNEADCLKLKAAGFNGVLIGEALMRSKEPKTFIQHLKTSTNNVYAS